MRRIIPIFLFLFSLSFVAHAQQTTEQEIELQKQKEKLQQQNSQIKKEISSLNVELQKNRSESKTSLVYVKNLEDKISAQEKLIRNLNKEKRLLEDEIYLTQLEINKLNRELGELKKEYREVLIKAYKNKSSENKLLFILSSKSLTEAYRRIKYLEKYSDYQTSKAEEIFAKQEEVQKKINSRKQAMKDKDQVLAQQTVFKEELANERLTKQKVYEEFQKNAGIISEQITGKQSEQKSIDKEIQKIIEEEIRLAKIRAENDKKAWDAAKRENTIAAYQNYLNEWTSGDYVLAARSTIQRLRADQKAWQDARGLHTKSAYQKYLSEFPQGQFASTAQIEIGKFQAAEEAAKVERERAQREAEALAARTEAPVKVVEEKPIVVPKRAENPKPDPAPAVTYEERTAVSNLSNDFASNKGRLPWPVDRGRVIIPFGVSKHPVLNLEINNNGVDIATSKGSSAKAVFDGEVSSIINIPGGSRTVLLRHGGYFTVYNNLSNVSVKKGDKVKRGQVIGRIYTNDDGDTILGFELRNGAAKQNPAQWIGGM